VIDDMRLMGQSKGVTPQLLAARASVTPKGPHMRKVIAAFVTVAAIGGVLTFNLLPAAGAGGATNIHVIGTVINQAQVGGGPVDFMKFGQGSGFVQNEALTSPSGAPMGHDGVICIATSPIGDAGGEFSCTAALVLPRGQIVVTGILSITTDDFTLAVTGGTGAYRNAHGEVHGHDVSDNVTDLRILLT
jgi:hypothetical protein